MKARLNALAASLLVTAAGAPGQSLYWVADMASPRPAAFSVYRGDAVPLEASIRAFGSNVPLAGAECTFHWQTNGMGAAWWTAPAAVVTGSPDRVRYVWAASNDCGAAAYTFFFRASPTNGMRHYTANGTLAMLPSPGAEPNALPLPVPSIDFSSVAALNAPWLLPPATNALWQAVLAETADRIAGTNAILQAVGAIPRDRIVSADGSQWIDATGGVWRAVEGTGGWALTLPSYPYEAHVGEIDWYAPAGYSEYADPGSWALYVESTGTGFDISVVTGFGEWGAGDVQPISPITLSPVGMGAEGDVTLWLSGGANTSRVDGVAWQSDIAAIRTNYVALADKELHADSFTNLIWRSVFSNGWHFLIAYTNTPGGAE